MKERVVSAAVGACILQAVASAKAGSPAKDKTLEALKKKVNARFVEPMTDNVNELNH